MRLFLAVDNSAELQVPDSEYRPLYFTGRTYTEDGYRDWVSSVWGVERDAPFPVLVATARAKGWTTLEVMTSYATSVSDEIG